MTPDPSITGLLTRIALAVEGLLARMPVEPAAKPLRLPRPERRAATPAKAEAFIKAWNANCGTLPKADGAPEGSARAKNIQACLDINADIARWGEAAKQLAASPHHRGSNDRGWVADLDFLIRGDQRQKWLEKAAWAPTRRPEAEVKVLWCASCGTNAAIYGPGTRNPGVSAGPICGKCHEMAVEFRPKSKESPHA